MRKLVVLALLLVAGMLWAQATVTLTGEVETRWLQDFTNKNFSQEPEVVVGVTAKVDGNNTAYIEIEEGPRAEFLAQTTDVTIIFPFDKAYFTTNVGAVLGLPVPLTWRIGFDEYDLYDAVKVTWGEWEDTIGSDLHAWGSELNLTVDPVMVRFAWANDTRWGSKGFLVGIAGNVAPLYFEAGYYELNEETGKGDIEAGVEFAQDMAEGINVAAAATLNYDIENAAGDSQWTAGAAAVVTYNKMASAGVAWKGVQDNEAGGLQVDLWAKPSADQPLEVFVALGIGLDDDVYPETFDSLEGSVKYMMGASTWYLGVMWIADGGVGIAREKSDWVTPATDSTSIFMRAELKY